MNCLECGNEFTPKNKVQKFCKPKCCTDWSNKKKAEKLHQEFLAKREHSNCVECGKELTGKKSKFCSKRCCSKDQTKRVAAIRMSVLGDIKCKGCGQSFSSTKRRKYCSNRCSHAYFMRTYRHAPKVKRARERARVRAEKNVMKQCSAQANELWTKLRTENEAGGGYCCECGAKKNSHNRSLYCESCKRVLNRLVLTLSEAANLA